MYEALKFNKINQNQIHTSYKMFVTCKKVLKNIQGRIQTRTTCGFWFRSQMHYQLVPFTHLCGLVMACVDCDPQRHSFHFEQVSFQSMLTRLSYQCAKKCRQIDGQTDRQTAFQLYIVDISEYHGLYGYAVSYDCFHLLKYANIKCC